LFFIGLVDEIGKQRLELELDSSSNTIDDQLLKLRQQYDSENLQAWLLTITINRQFVESSQQIKAGDEIALVPRNRTD
jgi:molybdopterin converting factor small subunit